MSTTRRASILTRQGRHLIIYRVEGSRIMAHLNHHFSAVMYTYVLSISIKSILCYLSIYILEYRQIINERLIEMLLVESNLSLETSTTTRAHQFIMIVCRYGKRQNQSITTKCPIASQNFVGHYVRHDSLVASTLSENISMAFNSRQKISTFFSLIHMD